MQEWIGIGRRKTAVASVRLRKGTGKVLVNGKALEEYFPISFRQETVLSPFQTVKADGMYDAVITVKGGGLEGQVIACRLGVARALVLHDADRRNDLKSEGFLRRDPRKRERKKYGLAGARKRFQFSKR